MSEPNVHRSRVARQPYEFHSYQDGCEAMVGLPSGVRLHCNHCDGNRMLPAGVMANAIDHEFAPPAFGYSVARMSYIEAFRLLHQGCGGQS